MEFHWKFMEISKTPPLAPGFWPENFKQFRGPPKVARSFRPCSAHFSGTPFRRPPPILATCLTDLNRNFHENHRKSTPRTPPFSLDSRPILEEHPKFIKISSKSSEFDRDPCDSPKCTVQPLKTDPWFSTISRVSTEVPSKKHRFYLGFSPSYSFLTKSSS